MQKQDGLASRKFLLAAFAMLCSAYGLFAGFIDGGTWVASISLVLGLYGAANVVEHRQ